MLMDAVSPWAFVRFKTKGKRNDKMSKYRFAGVVREIRSFPSGKTDNEVGFVPDREYAVTEKRGKDEILFVVLLPEDGKEGIVFKYGDNVHIIDKSKAKKTRTWKVNGHYALELENVEEKNCDIEMKDAPTTKYFRIESVTEKA